MRSCKQLLPNTTPEQFCRWLHKWIENFNSPLATRMGYSFPLESPHCIDIVQGDPPYKIIVKRQPHLRRPPVITRKNNRRTADKPRGYEQEHRNRPPRHEEPPKPNCNSIALEITLSKQGTGLEMQVNCSDEHGLQLEDFIFALIDFAPSVESKPKQSLADLLRRVREQAGDDGTARASSTGIPDDIGREAFIPEEEIFFYEPLLHLEESNRKKQLLAAMNEHEDRQNQKRIADALENNVRQRVEMSQEMEEQPVISRKTEASSSMPAAKPVSRGPRLMIQIKATLVHYAHTVLGIGQDIAASRADTTPNSYRKYRVNDWLLSDKGFHRHTGKTIAEYWHDATGG